MDANVSQLKRVSSSVLQIDWGEKVLMQFAGVQKKVASEVIGFDKDKFILLRLPVIPGLNNYITPGSVVSIRYMHSSRIFYGFSASIAGAIASPFPLLFINYPSTVEMLPLRKHERMDCLIKATLYHNAESYLAVILNLSEGGCRLMLEALDNSIEQTVPDMVQGAAAICQFKLPGEQEEIIVNSVIRGRFEINNRITFGLQFIDIDNDFHKCISRYINKFHEYTKDMHKVGL